MKIINGLDEGDKNFKIQDKDSRKKAEFYLWVLRMGRRKKK